MIHGSFDTANKLCLFAPGAANNGTVTVTYSAPSWLKYNNADPSVVATFSGYRAFLLSRPSLLIRTRSTAWSIRNRSPARS